MWHSWKHEVAQWVAFAPFAPLLKDCSCMQSLKRKTLWQDLSSLSLWLVMNDLVILTVLMIDGDISLINSICHCDKYWPTGRWKQQSSGWIHWLHEDLTEVVIMKTVRLFPGGNVWEEAWKKEILNFGSKTELGRWRKEKRQPRLMGDSKRKSVSKEKQNVLRKNFFKKRWSNFGSA